jgi:hypothetical protein
LTAPSLPPFVRFCATATLGNPKCGVPYPGNFAGYVGCSGAGGANCTSFAGRAIVVVLLVPIATIIQQIMPVQAVELSTDFFAANI